MKETKKKKKPGTSIGESSSGSISAFGAVFVYLITGLFLAVGFWVARNKYSVDLISDPAFTLRLLWVSLVLILFRSGFFKFKYFLNLKMFSEY